MYLSSLSPASRSHSLEVIQWLEKYHREKDRSPSASNSPRVPIELCKTRALRCKSPKKVSYKDNRPPLHEISSNQQLCTESPVGPKFLNDWPSSAEKENMFQTPEKSELTEDEMVTTPRRVIREQPKKRWLRAAFQDASLRVDDKNADLAKPIHWGNDDISISKTLAEDHITITKTIVQTTPYTPSKLQERPTVLVCAGDRPWPTKQVM